MGHNNHLKQGIMEAIFITGIVFYGFYQIIRVISEHFLKRKLIQNGHVEQAGILVTPDAPAGETQRYPSLKWGLVAFTAGLGLIIIEIIRSYPTVNTTDLYETALPYGIELVFISLGFLIYFFLVNRLKKQENPG